MTFRNHGLFIFALSAFAFTQASGFKSNMKNIIIRSPAMTFLNISSLISTAINAPAMLPRATGSSSLESVLKSSIFFCLKLLTDTTFCNKIAIRLVAFATFAGKPMKIRKGTTNMEPPPANVLINPAAVPRNMVTMISIIVMEQS